MGGKYICPEYRKRWIETLKVFPIEERKLSRYYFTRDLPFWHYPPFCKFGYVCKKCWQVRKLWEHCCKDDFEDIYQQVISGHIQQTLF